MNNKIVIMLLVGFIAFLQLVPGIPIPPEYAATVEVDPEVSSIVAKFYSEAAEARPIRSIYVPIKFVRGYDNEDVARCYQVGPFKLIHLSRDYWGNTNEVAHEALVYHELGHCVLGKKHEGQGLMRAWVLENSDYTNNRAKYLRELFSLDIKAEVGE